MAGARDHHALAAAIRHSTALDPVMKRHWLRVLPHLAPRERARLEEILRPPAPTGHAGPASDGERR
jgi:hypothetical protein